MSKVHFKPDMRQGISASCVFLDKLVSPVTQQAWPSILDFLVERFPAISRDEWLGRMQRGLVLDEQGQPVSADTAYRPYGKVFYYREVAKETEVPFKEKVLFESEHLLVVDKPHFLAVSPTGKYVQQTLLSRLKQRYASDQLSPIHRLDRETAGVMLFSRQPESRHVYHALFQKRQVEKTYQAIARFNPDLQLPMHYQSCMAKGEPFFRMQEIAGEPNSSTWIELLECKGNLARYRLKPVTGKQHQLRVHLAALNIPILHDPFYPDLVEKAGDDFSQPLQLLAEEISFIDPLSKAKFTFKTSYTLEFAS